ncbi:hypothetical protein ILYODFUR_011839 [Ilyodon furcidens]|uniref:Uncharacterized protein n=1 Tax=Ilyodon furcidens TaxID=33524 RepID=A0ABV0THW0_9TELE
MLSTSLLHLPSWRGHFKYHPPFFRLLADNKMHYLKTRWHSVESLAMKVPEVARPAVKASRMLPRQLPLFPVTGLTSR